jgi:hypothetical protein
LALSRAIPSRQDGVALLLLIVSGIVIFGGLLIIGLATEQDRFRNREQVTAERIERARLALVAFAAAQERLPCPANPTLNTGLSDNMAATPQTCDSPNGTLPWNTLGLSPDQALDGWGRRLSYRVYSGARGFTQFGGTNMRPCDTDNLAVLKTDVDPVTGLCNADHNSLDTDFLTGKGLTGKEDDMPAASNYAFVLISHGTTGYGAYSADGVLSGNLPAAGGDEQANMLAPGPGVQYVRKRANNRENMAPTMAAFFDDIVVMMTIGDLVAASGRTAFNWPD